MNRREKGCQVKWYTRRRNDVLKIKNSTSDIEIDEEMALIKVIVNDTKDIFEKLGYRSLDDRVLNEGFETYIMNSIKNYPLKSKVSLIISFMKEDDYIDITSIKKAIHTHFKYKAEEKNLSLKEQFRQWMTNMTIGLLFLILCIILVEVLGRFSDTNLVKIIKESLLIIGWVALWEPITFILFGWRNEKRSIYYYEKLSQIDIYNENVK